MTMFHELHSGNLQIHSLNFGNINLRPKIKEAKRIEQYKPICLLNVSFKIFKKVLNYRFYSIEDKIICPSQIAFLRGRNILEEVVILHETIHELHHRKMNGVILKIAFEKVYDKIKWPFLMQTLQMKGFSHKWCSWVEYIISGDSVATKVNDDIGPYIQTKKEFGRETPSLQFCSTLWLIC